MFESLERGSFCTLIKPPSLFILKKDSLETAPLVMFLNFSEIELMKGTVNQIFLSEPFSAVLIFCLIILSLIKPLILDDIVLKIKPKG